jgi:hypothetical protein
VDLEEDGYIKFIELEPGELVVDVTLRSMDLVPADADISPLELYEYFTGNEAPAALKKAFARVPEPGENIDTEKVAVEEGGVDMPAAQAKRQLTDADFQAHYCATGTCDWCDWDWSDSCVSCTGCTGTRYVTRYCSYMRTTVHPYRGNVRLCLMCWSGSTWYTLLDRIVLQGTIVYVCRYGSTCNRRSKVFEADGDLYNFSVCVIN